MTETVPVTSKNPGWKALMAALCALALSALLLNARAAAFTKQANASEAQLNEALSDFSETKVARLRAEVNAGVARAAALSGLFDPREKWTRAGYDTSILFAEELSRANADLKAHAVENQTEFPGFTFADKLPSESDAGLLLGQLYAMRLVSQLALDLGARIELAKPMPLPKEEASRLDRPVSAEFEMSFPHETIVDFLIRFNGIVPKLVSSVLKARVEDQSVHVSLRYSTLRLDIPDVKALGGTIAPIPDSSFPSGIDAVVAALRGKSPLAIPAKQVVVQDAVVPVEEAKPAQRFFYKGRAVLQKKDVAVLEDALRGETLFLSAGEKFDVFRLKEFSDTEVILESNENFLTVIKREDQ